MSINPTNMEIVLQQVSYHCDLADILNLRTVSKFMKYLISECIYTHIMVVFDDIVNNYQLFKCFQSLQCVPNFITDIKLQYLGKCHTLDLSFCKSITDEGIKHLGKCHTLDLSWCSLITDEGIKYLGKCHTLDLSWCSLITDEGIKYLGKCHTLDLTLCYKITEDAVNKLRAAGVVVK